MCFLQCVAAPREKRDTTKVDLLRTGPVTVPHTLALRPVSPRLGTSSDPQAARLADASAQVDQSIYQSAPVGVTGGGGAFVFRARHAHSSGRRDHGDPRGLDQSERKPLGRLQMEGKLPSPALPNRTRDF